MLGLWRQNSSKGDGGDDSSGMPRETSHGEEWQTSSQSTKAGALQVRDILRKKPAKTNYHKLKHKQIRRIAFWEWRSKYVTNKISQFPI